VASVRSIPAHVRKLPIGKRILWARKQAHLSHDRLVEQMGRSNRSHLIKVEKGAHIPGPDLRDAIADATGFPRDLFVDDDGEDSRDVFGAAMQKMFDRAIEAAASRAADAAIAAMTETQS
jgi:transcriptional regulator with XRE-family HTH domain